MDLSPQSLRVDARPVRTWVTRERVVLYSLLALALFALFAWIWVRARASSSAMITTRPGADFSVFWAASYVMLHGAPWQAYDYPAFVRLLASLFPPFTRDSFLAWLYPPTYLTMVTPLALLPYAIAYPLFMAAGIALFGFAVWRVARLGALPGTRRFGWLVLIGCPCVFVTAVFGQNAFLTASFAALAVYWTDRRPAWAGVCIGLLAIKPQMALLFPFVLIAARAWRTFAWAAATAVAFVALSVLVCGVQSLRLFAANAGLARTIILEHSVVFWFASPTPFAALRIAGVPLAAAYAAQGCIAAIAIAAACIVWARTRDTRLRGAVLAVATLAANPYLWHYELVWLGIAFACIVSLGWRDGWRRDEQTAVVLMWALPAYEYLNPWMQLPQIGPAVILFALLVLLRRVRPEDRSRAWPARAHSASRGGAYTP
ncbi:glycosyltransferase family 87 protein [Burkholderia sp. MR1-5-21]